LDDNRDKPVLEFEISDLDCVGPAGSARQRQHPILYCAKSRSGLEIAAGILAKLEVKLTKLHEMQAQVTGAGGINLNSVDKCAA
jgi:hypothetical protein